tara:strand:- start:2308 stop:2793 length:486 start_codon:yes stop_codon:yes gene_type:complete
MYVESKVSLRIPKSQILNLITKPGNLEKFHPFCKNNIAIKWPGNGSIDKLEYLNGLILVREFYNWSDDGYTLKIGAKKNMAVVNWIVEGNNTNSSLLIRINPNIENFISFKSILIKRMLWFLYLKPMLQIYINHVIKGFKYYMVSENIVLPNQFGKHRWFS